MSRKRKRDLTSIVHTHRDAVTGKLVREVRDAVWWATFRAWGAVEAAQGRVPMSEGSAPRDAFVFEAQHALDLLEAGETHDGATEPIPTLVREWDNLDAAGRHRFAKGLRAKLLRMVAHTESELRAAETQTEAA